MTAWETTAGPDTALRGAESLRQKATRSYLVHQERGRLRVTLVHTR